ncbi:MAG: ankyrin repeat domain-containing protein, partial [Proteobacteria bacterium]
MPVSAPTSRVVLTVAVMALVASFAARAHTDPLPAPDGSTPLQAAVFRGDIAEVKRLIAARVDVKQPNDYGVTAMELAAETGNSEMLQALLAAGADVESPNGEGQTALMSVAR